MTTLALIATLFGATLGVRFTVFALIPAIACASLVAGVGWIVSDGAFSALVIDLLLLVTTVQVGYLCGAALRLSLGFTGVAVGQRAPNSAAEKTVSQV